MSLKLVEITESQKKTWKALGEPEEKELDSNLVTVQKWKEPLALCDRIGHLINVIFGFLFLCTILFPIIFYLCKRINIFSWLKKESKEIFRERKVAIETTVKPKPALIVTNKIEGAKELNRQEVIYFLEKTQWSEKQNILRALARGEGWIKNVSFSATHVLIIWMREVESICSKELFLDCLKEVLKGTLSQEYDHFVNALKKGTEQLNRHPFYFQLISNLDYLFFVERGSPENELNDCSEKGTQLQFIPLVKKAKT